MDAVFSQNLSRSVGAVNYFGDQAVGIFGNESQTPVAQEFSQSTSVPLEPSLLRAMVPPAKRNGRLCRRDCVLA